MFIVEPRAENSRIFKLKVSIIILVISVVRDDWMIGVVAAIILSLGNAGFMLLAHVIRRLNDGSY